MKQKTIQQKAGSGNYANKPYAGTNGASHTRSLPEGTFAYFNFLEKIAKKGKHDRK